MSSAQNDDEGSTSSVAGIVAGCVVGVVVIVITVVLLVLLVWYWRRWSRKKNESTQGSYIIKA